MTYAVIDHRMPVLVTDATFVWEARRDGIEIPETEDLFRDIYVAFPLVLSLFLQVQYGWHVGIDPLSDAPKGTYTWHLDTDDGTWCLYENDDHTGVRLRRRRVVGKEG